MQSERQLNERPNYNRIIFFGIQSADAPTKRNIFKIYTTRAQCTHTNIIHIFAHTQFQWRSDETDVSYEHCLSATFRNPVSKFTFQTTHGKPADSLFKNNAFRSSSEGQLILKKVLFGASFRILSNLYHIGLVFRVKNASCWWLLFSSCGYMATSTTTRID